MTSPSSPAPVPPASSTTMSANRAAATAATCWRRWISVVPSRTGTIRARTPSSSPMRRSRPPPPGATSSMRTTPSARARARSRETVERDTPRCRAMTSMVSPWA